MTAVAARVRDRLLANLEGVAQARGRRLTVRLEGRVPTALRSAVLLSGWVRKIVATTEPVDWALVALAPDTDLPRIAYLARTGAILFDPKATAPVEVIRLAREAWTGTQAWVLPLDGPDALTEGLVLASNDWSSDTPRFSCSMPVNLEENDVERTLASFLPIAQEWVVGVDEKSTDGTLAIVERYAEVVFRFSIEPWSFAEARNRTLRKSSSPWCFQTEGHEHLHPDSIPSLRIVGRLTLPIGVVMVERDTGGGDPNAGEVFSFPWIFRNHPDLRFSDTGGVHNALESEAYAKAVAAADGVVTMRFREFLRTIHKPHPTNRKHRDAQRNEMNREALDGYVEDGGARTPRALFYAAQEHASAGNLREAVRRAIDYLRAKDGFLEQRYEGHLRLAEYLIGLKKPRMAIPILKAALPLDTNRNEVEYTLADCMAMRGDLEAARQLYAKAAAVPLPAYANLFVRRAYYRALPWAGLAVVCLDLGHLGDAARAAQCALSLDPANKLAQEVAKRLAPYGEPVDSAA